LQIYHTGAKSVVSDQGTGNLQLQGNDLQLVNATDTATYLYAVNGSFTKLYHNNSEKLATTATGIDVTGTVTADQLTVDGTSRFNNYIHFGGSISTPSTAAAIYRPADNNLAFSTANTEAMRIDSSQRILCGTTDTDVFNNTSGNGINIKGIAGLIEIAVDSGEALYLNRMGSDGRVVNIRKSGTFIGGINVTTSAVSYNTSSDYRLKTAVEYDWDATSRLKQLKPARFEWISDGDDAVPVDGFLAHEVQDVVPEAITGTKDGMMDEEYEVTPAVEATYDDDGNILTEFVPAVMGTRSVPDYQGIDQGKLVPLLVKSLQEALTKIDEQSLKIGELETRIASLEAN
jgi:hypothetical protein